MADQRDFDVIIIGGGGAGLAAAVEASRAGASTVIVEAGNRLGGSTALSAGIIYAAGTSVQREAGFDDSADAMFEYCMAVTQNRMDGALVRRFCDDSAELVDWLKALGAEFDPRALYTGGLEGPGIRRSHGIAGYGPRLIELLEAAISQCSVDVALQTRVQELLVDDSGTVRGIRTGGDDIRAGAVILTCGGFGNNPAMVAEHYPEVVEAAGDWLWYMGHEHCVGDGLDMACRAGGAISGHNRGLIGLTHHFALDNEVFHPEWLVFVNRDGRRFMREFTAYGVGAQSVLDQPGKSCFAIFDEVARRVAAARPEFMGLMDQHWTADGILEFAEQGKLITAPTLEDLACKAGINGEILARTVATYNRDCDAGCDTTYKKLPKHLLPIREAPFYAAEIRPAALAATFTGVRINRDAQVLSIKDRPIAGLFAAGETTSSMGQLYVGGGNAVANALVFGRIAGTNAASWAGR